MILRKRVPSTWIHSIYLYKTMALVTDLILKIGLLTWAASLAIQASLDHSREKMLWKWNSSNQPVIAWAAEQLKLGRASDFWLVNSQSFGPQRSHHLEIFHRYWISTERPLSQTGEFVASKMKPLETSLKAPVPVLVAPLGVLSLHVQGDQPRYLLPDSRENPRIAKLRMWLECLNFWGATPLRNAPHLKKQKNNTFVRNVSGKWID